MLRIVWRKGWLECLYEFASLQFQRGLWVEGTYKGMIGCFTECMCGYFDDLNLADGYKWAIDDGLVTQEEAAIMQRFHQVADQYGSTKSDREILEDMNWHKVVREAAKAWHSLRTAITHPEDRAVVNYLEERFGEVSLEDEGHTLRHRSSNP